MYHADARSSSKWNESSAQTVEAASRFDVQDVAPNDETLTHKIGVGVSVFLVTIPVWFTIIYLAALAIALISMVIQNVAH
jgi:hypothetical protein